MFCLLPIYGEKGVHRYYKGSPTPSRRKINLSDVCLGERQSLSHTEIGRVVAIGDDCHVVAWTAGRRRTTSAGRGVGRPLGRGDRLGDGGRQGWLEAAEDHEGGDGGDQAGGGNDARLDSDSAKDGH